MTPQVSGHQWSGSGECRSVDGSCLTSLTRERARLRMHRQRSRVCAALMEACCEGSTGIHKDKMMNRV